MDILLASFSAKYYVCCKPHQGDPDMHDFTNLPASYITRNHKSRAVTLHNSPHLSILIVSQISVALGVTT